MEADVIERWRRSQRAAVVDIGEDVALIDRDTVRRLEGDSAELARVVLAHLSQPRTTAEVIDHVESLAGPLGERRGVVHELLGHLAETGALAPDVDPPATTSAVGINIVVAISGAIAASHAPALVMALQRRGHTVEVALTPTATRFVAQDALSAILRREPHTSLWPPNAHSPVPHVALAQWADLVVVYPASGTTIGRIANGDFSDLVAAIALTTRAPVVIVPSMNVDMIEAPAVQRNLDALRAAGHLIVHGVPAQEVADAPALRAMRAGGAPAPSEVVATIDALRAAGMLGRHDDSGGARPWDAAYRKPLVPWASDDCDPDLATALATHAPTSRRVLDLGCGLGQVARHAARSGHRVVATDVSEVALALARDHEDSNDPGPNQIIWLRDDCCASALVGPFDVIVDRASLHALPRARASAWAATIHRILARGGIVIVKAHRDGLPGITTGWTAQALAALLPDFTVVSEQAATLPGITDREPVPAVLVVLRS